MHHRRSTRIIALLGILSCTLAAGTARSGPTVPILAFVDIVTQVTVVEPGVHWIIDGTGEGTATHVGPFYAAFHYDVYLQTGEVTGRFTRSRRMEMSSAES